jgi:hypothetical protein
MSAARRCGSRRPERAAVGDNGYVETDPTGRYGRVRMHVLLFFFFFAFSFSSFQLVIQYICMFLSRVVVNFSSLPFRSKIKICMFFLFRFGTVASFYVLLLYT